MKTLLTTGFCLLLGLSLVTGCGGSGSALSSAVTPGPSSRSSSAIAVALTTANPTSSTIGVSYSLSMTATVSNDPNNKGVNWTVNCPSGVTVCGSMAKASSASGAADTYNAPSSVPNLESLTVTVTATSVADPAKSAFINVVVEPGPTLVNPPPPPPLAGNVGQYLAIFPSIWVQGGTGQYAYKLKSGTLPSGLTIDIAAQAISGIPKAVYASTAVVTVTDSGFNPPISLNVSIPITINPMLPFASSLRPSGALPGGTVGVGYNKRWICGFGCRYIYGLGIGGATGGVERYAFSWAAATGSSLPPGLNLSYSVWNGPIGCITGCFASIGGTPTTAGTYNFVVTVSDSESPPQHASTNYTITVSP